MPFFGQQRPHDASETLPSAIWMPTFAHSRLPNVYQGSPLEMVVAMADEMGEHLGVHDSLDLAIQFLKEQRGIKITISSEAPEDKRAKMFIHALLISGVAQPMAKA